MGPALCIEGGMMRKLMEWQPGEDVRKQGRRKERIYTVPILDVT